MGAVGFMPSLEDAMPVRINDRQFCLGENDCTVKVSKRAQANKSLGEGGHHVALHGCRGKSLGRGKGCAGNQSHREAVCHLETHCASLLVQVSDGRIRRKISTAGAGVDNASVGGWKVGGITV